MPQESVPPQPSEPDPHCSPSSAHVLGLQLRHTLSTQISPSAQLPQLAGAPVHALLMVPQFFPWRLHSAGGGVGLQRLATHDSVEMQPLPQVSTPPHPSEIVPHSAPVASQVVGRHGLQVFAIASQARPGPHASQVSSPPQPSLILPQRPAHAFLTQSSHWPVAPLQTLPAAHAPQSKPPPHASFTIPQVTWTASQAPARSTHA